jgi:hypothetical protein
LIDWSPFVIMGNTMPPRDLDEDEEDEDEEGEDRADEPPVVREPDEEEHDAFRIGHSLSFGNSWRILCFSIRSMAASTSSVGLTSRLRTSSANPTAS